MGGRAPTGHGHEFGGPWLGSQGYREAEKSSRGRPRPKPVRVGGPLVFLALAPAPAKNTYDAHPIFCGHPTLFGGWPQPEAILASVSNYFITLFCR